MKKRLFKLTLHQLISACIVVLFVGNFIFYLHQYFHQQNYFYSKDWQYGHKEAVEYVKSIEGEYDKVVVSNQEPLDQTHMFWLFYLRYPPQTYQKEAFDASGGFQSNHAFGKYEFRPIDFGKEVKDGKTLFVGRPGDFPNAQSILKQINYLNGKPAIYIVVR